MSYDLAVWEGERPADNNQAKQVFQSLCDRYIEAEERQLPTDLILRFVGALLERWDDVTSDAERPPSSPSPPLMEANGPFIYFPTAHSRRKVVSAEAAEIAAAMGLVCYDPQLGQLRP
jgi:hypothetical protein